jgi:hypothetical protein
MSAYDVRLAWDHGDLVHMYRMITEYGVHVDTQGIYIKKIATNMLHVCHRLAGRLDDSESSRASQ